MLVELGECGTRYVLIFGQQQALSSPLMKPSISRAEAATAEPWTVSSEAATWSTYKQLPL